MATKASPDVAALEPRAGVTVGDGDRIAWIQRAPRMVIVLVVFWHAAGGLIVALPLLVIVGIAGPLIVRWATDRLGMTSKLGLG